MGYSLPSSSVHGNFQARVLEWVAIYPPANAGDMKNASSIPGSGRSPGVGNGNLLKYSCLGNPMDRGAWSPWDLKELDMTEHIHKVSINCVFWIFKGKTSVI